jgi:chromosome segregation protein
MDATRQNLLRVSDVIEEIGRRLGSLRRQAQKAERYKRYKEEMRDIELWSASHRLLELVALQKLADADADTVERDRDDAERGLQRQEAEIETARIEATSRERELNQLQEQLYQADNRIKLNENRVEFESRESVELRRRSEQSQGEIEELKRQIERDQQREDEVRGQAAELREQRESRSAALAAKEQVLRSVRGELGAVDSVLEQERELLRAAERVSARAEADLQAGAHRREDAEQQLVRCRDEAAQAQQRRTELEAQASDLQHELDVLEQGRTELVTKREESSARLEELEQLAERGEAELEVLRTELHRRRSRLTSLEEIQARYEGFGHGTRAVMQRHNGESRQRGVLGVVADVIDTPPDYEVALEAVLGHKLGAVIVEDADVGVDAIHYLKAESLGRGSFISRYSEQHSMLTKAPVGFVWDPDQAGSGSGAPSVQFAGDGSGATVQLAEGVKGPMLGLVACDDEYRAVAESLLGDVVVVENLERAMALWKRAERHTLVTLDGEILQPDGTVTGGSQDGENSGVLQQKREIKQLSEIIADLQQQYDDAHERHVGIKTEIASLQQLLERLRHDQHQSEKEVLARDKDLSRANSEIDVLAQRHQSLSGDVERLSNTIEELQRQKAQTGEELLLSAEQQWVGQDTLALLLRERQRLAGLEADAATAATDVKVALAQCAAACEATERNLRQIEQLGKERRSRVERLTRDAEQGATRALKLDENVARMRQELEELVTDRARLQEELSEGRSRYDEQLGQLGELETALKETRTHVGQLATRLGELQLRRSELKMAREHLEEQIWDRYREELPRVAGDYHLRPPVSAKHEERIGQLRQLIDRMGEINLTAIEEYDELSGRFEFLSQQKTDLESALNQLQRAIQKINRTCRERFVSTFDAVNEKFQQVFPRLFKGGRARLQLTESEDVLQGGVEIVAQPPGKKLVSIDMMSGGEKALTATSLIFAMFLVKPTPFCLLDEVDAPLDDANVIRLRDLIAEMSGTSQFIMITHNHTTMEAADRLYGVTMEEPGISKLVSVNLSEAQKVAA